MAESAIDPANPSQPPPAAMDRQEYPTMLATLQPLHAHAVLSDRVRHIQRLNTDIADWLADRVKLEIEYAQGLKKLAKRSPPDAGAELGVFDTPWRKILTATDTRADAVANLAKRVEQDVVRPLRDFDTSQLSTVQGNLLSLAKDYDRAQRNIEKSKGKAGVKQHAAAEELDSAAQQWESQAPYVFETLQATDESRWNHLRDVLTQYHTHEIDQAQRIGAASESVLNSLLNIETADEIKTFAIKNTGSGGVSRSDLARSTSRLGESSPTLSPPPSRQARHHNGDDRAAQQPDTLEEKTEKPEKKGGFGLKRLGTVLGRRKSTVPKPSPSKKGGSLQAIQDDEPEDAGGSSFLGASSRDRPDPPRTFSGIEAATAPGTLQERSLPATNGATETPPQLALPLLPQSATAPISQPASTAGITAGTAAEHAVQSDAAPYAAPSPPLNQSFASSLSDIDRAQQEAAGAAGDQPYRMDIRNAPIAEDESESSTVMANVANTLRLQAAPQTRRAGTVRGRRDVRNTMFVPSPEPGAQPFVSAPQATIPEEQPTGTGPAIAAGAGIGATAGAIAAAAPVVGHRTGASEDHATSDSQSIRSGYSLASSYAVAKHPEVLLDAGVNASVVETVSTWFENGSITRAVVIGELALAHNPAAQSQSHVSMRLDNFTVLEKVAPNPAFVHQPAADKPGEYTLDTTSLGSNGRPNVAFKYQVHLDESTVGRHAPLHLHPQWRVEANQTSVIVAYSLNPDFAASLSRAITLHNVIISVHLDGSARALSCQSRPAGTFSKERNLIYWRLDELVLAPGAAAEKLLVRFATDGPAKPGHVEARWEITGRATAGLGSGLGISVSESSSTDPFADESAGSLAWKVVEPVRKLISGTYQAS